MDEIAINFSGVTHDHSSAAESVVSSTTNVGMHQLADNTCSSINILRRTPMYDCLILVKKYRNCIGGYSLEFPTGSAAELDPESVDAEEQENQRHTSQVSSPGGVCQRRLVSRFLDGDDPIDRRHRSTCSSSSDLQLQAPSSPSEPPSSPLVPPADQTETIGRLAPLPEQVDDRGEACELVHVPINGLIDRLRSYTEAGVAVDSRVYAFSMGLKTAERLLTTSAMRELHETPI